MEKEIPERAFRNAHEEDLRLAEEHRMIHLILYLFVVSVHTVSP
jgi:hypothetical protein